MQIFAQDFIGTHIEIRIDTEISCEVLFREVDHFVGDFEQRFSRFRTDNWLFHLNQERSWILDSHGRTMLEYMLSLVKKTEGYFDPTIARRLSELGYGNPLIPLSITEEDSGKIHTATDIIIEWDTVTLPHGAVLEFGGVGKWYLIDCIREMIEKYFWATKKGISHSRPKYLLNFWGDMYGYWFWKIGLESPFASDEIIWTISFEDDFLACSAGTKRRWWDFHHLIDPKTGMPSREVCASYVETSGWLPLGGMIADSYATTLCVMPWALACETLEKTPEISGVIVKHDGFLYQKSTSRAKIFVSS